ncbi:MAG: GTP-binding protein [Nanoarchaeota archaeon]|nr:GTP-binding protein [Nanoarchaeota archaeon]
MAEKPKMAGIPEKIREIEEEISKTKYNKRTQSHFAILKAQIAQLKEKQMARGRGKGKTEGYTVKKSGDATAIIVGFPSVGKSTLLNDLTKQHSAVAAYAFTTLTCIPGMLEHKGSKIQVLDVPGIIEGAASGKGRGREVLSVAMSADLVMFVLDVFQVSQYHVLMKEVRDFNLRLNEEQPDVRIKRKAKGGLSIGSTVKLTRIDLDAIKGILHEFRIANADVVIRTDIGPDQLIDAIEGNKRYVRGLVVVNKMDLVGPEELERIRKEIPVDVFVSASEKIGIEELKDALFERLGFIRVFCKKHGTRADLDVPLILRKGATLKDMCDKLHRDFAGKLRYAKVWGSSKFPGQEIRKLSYVVHDGDVVELMLS